MLEGTTIHDQLEHMSLPFVGRWNRLISVTNWEKGRIIHQWRTAMNQGGADASAYSDEAWSLRVGGISSQHVRRLRRVYQRFGQTYPQFEGLYWSHFSAALEWDDAEMWLEGALQNGWSVVQMKQHRNETRDLIEQSPAADRVPANDNNADDDDDFVEDPAVIYPLQPASVVLDLDGPKGNEIQPEEEAAAVGGLSPQDPDESPSHLQTSLGIVPTAEPPSQLPADLEEAYEGLKLAILRHKMDGWRDVSAQQLLSVLEALRQIIVSG